MLVIMMACAHFGATDGAVEDIIHTKVYNSGRGAPLRESRVNLQLLFT